MPNDPSAQRIERAERPPAGRAGTAPAPAPPCLEPARCDSGLLARVAGPLRHRASQRELRAFGLGIVAWRRLAQLAVGGPATAQPVSRVAAIDKVSASRWFKTMHARGPIAPVRSLHDRLPEVERATARYLDRHLPQTPRRGALR